ncbi:MAG: DUF521 domain-containing protein [Dehalococcoidales bacterium]|nr:DUF521 domain-containing protein [Dehalococcoidales bacterium]
MKLTDAEKALLDGSEGLARQKAMELLVKYGEALGAEVELYMGPEQERHVITTTTVVFIPPNFIHAPWNPLEDGQALDFHRNQSGLQAYGEILPAAIDQGAESRFRLVVLEGRRHERGV